MYPFTVYVHLYCHRNRKVEGRQVADPYGGIKFFGACIQWAVLVSVKFIDNSLKVIRRGGDA